MTTIGLCGFCGSALAPDGSRRCGCARVEPSLGNLHRVVAIAAANATARIARGIGPREVTADELRDASWIVRTEIDA